MNRVVVVGRDAALWLSVAALARALTPVGVSVVAIELPSALDEAGVYPSLPALEALHARIGFDEATLLRGTRGTYSLGTNIVGPGTPPFFLGWGTHGAPIAGQPFFGHWLRARAHGLDARLQDFSLVAAAATNGGLMFPDAQTDAFGRVDFAYSLPAIAYSGVLKGIAARLGVEMHQGVAVEAERDGESGAIAAVLLDSRPITGDLFVDGTGGAALVRLIADHGSKPSALPERRVLTALAPGLTTPPPYAEVRVAANGWLRFHPTAADTRVLFVTDEPDDDAVLAQSRQLAGLPLSGARISVVSRGSQREPWAANVVAVGAAAATFDPIHGVDLHALQLGIVHLLSLFPRTSDCAAERAEYNRIIGSAFDRLRDFQQAFHALAPWPGDFWDRARAEPVDPALAHKIATFRARGEIAPMEDETFLPDAWQALFVGLGVMPESWPPAIDATDPALAKAAFRQMFGFIRTKVLEQPTQAAYLVDIVGRAAA